MTGVPRVTLDALVCDLETNGASGRLVANLGQFARILRAAGLPVGPAATLDALKAIEAAGFGSREAFYWTLHAVFVKRREHSVLFRPLFERFWRLPRQGDALFDQLADGAKRRASEKKKPPPGAARVNEALFGSTAPPREEEMPSTDARFTASFIEVLKAKDFAQMSAAELALAKREITRLRLPDDTARTRRQVRGGAATIDLRRTLQKSMRHAGGFIDMAFKEPGEKHPPIVALCDISGSMADYSRLFLHFLHGLGSTGRRVHTFLFATRLTNITRALRTRDPDDALARCSGLVQDWDGGTRITSCLERFNKDWSRRVLGQGAIVLLITDGLERDVEAGLTEQMSRLKRSCRRLVWLNPLLGYDRFQAHAAGIKAMLPFVDEFRPIHNLRSMGDLVRALGVEGDAAAHPRLWLKAPVSEAPAPAPPSAIRRLGFL